MSTPLSISDNLPGTITPVIPGRLYITDLIGASDDAKLRSIGANLVVSIIHEEALTADVKAACLRLGIPNNYIECADTDNAPISNYFLHLEFMLIYNKVVVVHCREGISRSATLVLSYMIKEMLLLEKQGPLQVVAPRDFQSAKDRCLAKLETLRFVRPNDGFMVSLLNYERRIRAKLGMQQIPTRIHSSSSFRAASSPAISSGCMSPISSSRPYSSPPASSIASSPSLMFPMSPMSPLSSGSSTPGGSTPWRSRSLRLHSRADSAQAQPNPPQVEDQCIASPVGTRSWTDGALAEYPGVLLPIRPSDISFVPMSECSSPVNGARSPNSMFMADLPEEDSDVIL